MPEKIDALLQSRRFWVMALGVILLLAAPDITSFAIVVLGAAWIIGDSIRSTGAKMLLLAVTLCPGCHDVAFAGDVHNLCREATVRIRNGNSMGSGTVFREAGDYFYVLTNAHVAGTQLGNRVQLEFWKDGHQSRPVAGETVAVAYIPQAYRDIAVVRIAKSSLGNYRPAVIELARERDEFNYQNIFSVGCPAGRWPTAFNGFALRRNTSGGDTIHFVPMPAGGRSGSAIFDVNGDEPLIIGLVAWRSSDDGGHSLDGRGEDHGYGIAMTHNEVWAGLSGKQTTSDVLLVPPPGTTPVEHEEPAIGSGKPPQTPTPDPNPNAFVSSGQTGEVVLRYSDAEAVRQPPVLDSFRPPPGVPVTGTRDDVMLLYRDPFVSEPLASIPPIAFAQSINQGFCPYCGEANASGGGCRNGRCPQQRGGGGGRDGGGLFPSWPGDEDEEDDPGFIERQRERFMENQRPGFLQMLGFPAFKDLLPWLILVAVVLFFVGQYAIRRARDSITATLRQSIEAEEKTKLP